MANEACAADQTRTIFPGVCYFWGLTNRRIKIGYTTNPDLRLRTLRHQFNLPSVSYLATVAGPPELEREYHARFAKHRLGKAEWFAPAPEIMAEVERLKRCKR